MKPKTLAEFAALGGKASWKGISREERSKRMKKLANKRWKKGGQNKKVLPNSTIHTLP